MPRGRPRKMTIDETEIDANENARAAEVELMDFIDGLGPNGIAEVELYRCLSNGKQKFIVSGPPVQFSPAYVQQTYGGGDYLVRGRLDGKWVRSKMFSVEGPNLSIPANGNGSSHSADPEIERLRLQIQEQQMRMESERQASLQRSHEMQMALIQNFHNGGGGGNQMSIADMVAAVKNLNDLGGQDAIDKAIDRVFNLAGKVQQLTNPQATSGEGGWWDWAKPVVQEAGKQLLPRVIPFLGGNGAPANPATMAGPTASVVPPVPNPPPGPETVPPPVPPQLTEAQMEDAYLQQKREALTFALMMARANRHPEIWADMAIEQIETSNNPVTARFVSEIVKAENFEAWFGDLEKLDPTVVTQRQWFEIFYQCIKDTLAAKAEDTSES